MKVIVYTLVVYLTCTTAFGQIKLDTKPLDRTTPTPRPSVAPTPEPMMSAKPTPSPEPTAFSDSDDPKFVPGQKQSAAPNDLPRPDRWRGMVIDESSPADAVRILGQPKKDVTGQQLRVFGNVSHWLSKRQKQKLFRVLDFDLGKTGIQKASLYFLDDRLVRINLDLKSGEVSPNGIGNIYGVKFHPMVSQIDLRTFSRYSAAKTYPTVYSLVNISDRTFISAMVSNVPSVWGALGKSMGIPDAEASFPGKVEFVDIISRSLENMDGADILK